MKKVFSISLVMLMALCVFISCNPSSGVEDNVSVTLNAKNGEIELEKENLSWKYTAVKSDGLDPKDGETEEEKALNNSKTDPLSQGEWNFTLYGYKGSNLVCTGSAEKVEITKSNDTVDIDVSLLQKAEGTIVVSDDVAIKSTDGKTTYSLLEGYTMTLVISDKDGNVVTRKEYHSKAVFNTDSQTVTSGAYSITVTFSKDDVTATYTKNINVYDYLSTTISGSLNGVIIKADADKGGTEATTVIEEDVFETKTNEKGEEVVENAKVVEVVAPITATEESSTAETKETTVAFPAGSLKKTTTEETTEAVTLTVAAATATAASASTSDYSTKITTTDAAVVAGFEFNLSGADSSDLTSTQTTEDGKEEEVGVTVTTYVAKGLGTKDNLKIEYIGETEGKDPEIVSYDSTTGKLVFTVYHFSKYAIVSTNIVAQDSNGNVYTSLKDAMSGAGEGGTVTLLKGLSGLGETIETSKSLTLDLNGYSITSSTRVFLVHKGTLTISNGTVTADITANNGSSVIKVDSADGDAGVVLKSDATVKAPSSYGITAFGTANKATLDIYGTIESTNPCLAGNGSESYFKNTVTMNIYNGAVLTKNDSSSKKWTSNDDKVAVYQPNIGVLNIYGGTITCADGSAVEVRAGEANINGGTLKSNAAYSTKYNSNGPSVAGAAIAVSQHVTKQSVTVKINGGTFSGEKQLAVVDTLNDSTVDNKKIVKAVVKNGVEMNSAEIVGIRCSDVDGVAGNYYIDVASSVAAGETSKIHVTDLIDIAKAKGQEVSFTSGSATTSDVTIDGENKYVVDEWQDIWFGGNLTVKNIVFAKGAAFNAEKTTTERTITIENCTVYYCMQKDLVDRGVVNSNGDPKNFSNTGNGLCLSIDSPNNPDETVGKINVIIKNCELIGDNNSKATRKDSYSSLSNYNSKTGDLKGRGNGVGLGTSSGSGRFLKSVTIEKCTFEGLRNAALQIYNHFTAAVTVKDCEFKSWGVNADNEGSAIRGLVDVNSGASINITDCTFSSASLSKNSANMKCEIDNLLKDTDEPTKWTQTDGKWSASATAASSST